MIDLPGIEQHLFMTDRWKIMLNLIIMKLVFFQEDILQELPEFRDVPLAVAEVINDFAFCSLLC